MTTTTRRSTVAGTAIAAGCIAALLAALNGIVSKVALDAGLTPGMLTLFRMGGTTALAAVLLAVVDPRGFRLDRRDAVLTAILGVVGLSLANWFYAAAFAFVDVGTVVLIAFSSIALVAVVGRLFLGERSGPRLWIAIALVLAGLAVVTNTAGGRPIALIGLLLAVGAMCCYATYFLSARGVAQRRSPLSLVFWSCLWATAFWLFASGWWAFDFSLLRMPADLGGRLAGWELPLWMLVVYTFSAGALLPNLLSYRALQQMTATGGGIIASTEVLWSFGISWAWLDQSLTALQVVGIVVVLVGVLLAQSATAPRRHDEALTPLDGLG